MRALEKAAARARDRADDEAVHDLRVATRRLDASLEIWATFLKPGAHRRAAERLKRLRKVFGPVRDLEVQQEGLRARLPEVPIATRVVGEMIVARIERRLASRRGDLAHEIRPARLARLDRLTDRSLRGLASRLEARTDPLNDARAQVDELRRRFVATATEAVSSGDPGTLHQLRILVKKARYTLECLDDVLGVTIELGPLRTLQQSLGDLHDHVMLEERVNRFAAKLDRREASAAARALGALVERIQAERAKHLEETRRLVGTADASALFSSSLLALVPRNADAAS
jgi:CHAD domain-containing protein